MMNKTLYIFLLGLFVACKANSDQTHLETITEEEAEVPNIEWKLEDTFFDKKVSLWKFKSDSTEVSGMIVSFYPNGSLYRSTPVFQGKREGARLTYFPDGKLMFLENFDQNKLNGKLRKWGIKEGYQLMSELNYQDGRLHGEQKKWYASGELHMILHMENGKEDGMQQALRKNGALYANYEAKNGRVFGLKRTQLCFEVRDEQPVYN